MESSGMRVGKSDSKSSWMRLIERIVLTSLVEQISSNKVKLTK